MLVDERESGRADHQVSLKCFMRGGAAMWAMSANVAPGGVFIVTSQPPEPGTDMIVEVDLPDGAVRVRGVSVWARPKRQKTKAEPMGFGVRFMNPPFVWRRFVSSLPR